MPSYTLAQLQSLLTDQLDGNVGLYPLAQQTDVLNNAVRKLNFLTGMIEDDVTALTQASQLVYDTPNGIIIPVSVYVEGIELEKYSLRQLATKFRNWATDSTAAYGPMARWAPIGIGRYVIHPMDAVGGRLIHVNGVEPITPMVAPGDAVDLDDDFVPTLIDYARARVMLKLGGQPFAAASKSYQGFIRGVKDMVAWQGMVFPQYYVAASVLEPAEGKTA